jgi:hypothetical protein
LYVPLVVFLESARFALVPQLTNARHIAFAFFALFALRVADDLASADRDARDHPDRPRPPLGAGLVAIAFSGAVSLALIWPHIAVLAGLSAAMVLFYSFDARGERGVLGSLAVLVKYPVLVAILAGDCPTARGAAVLAIVFAAFVVYELADDAKLRPARALHATAGVLLMAGLAAIARGPIPIVAAIVAALVTVAVVRFHRLPWLVFVATAGALVATSWRP